MEKLKDHTKSHQSTESSNAIRRPEKTSYAALDDYAKYANRQ
jgi:hypothetical protein